MAPKQKGSSTSTQQTSYPDWITDSQQGLDKARDTYFNDQMAGGGAPLAGMNPTQQRAGQWYGSILNDNQPDYPGMIMDAGAPVTGAQIVEGMNPYLDRVGRDTLNAMGRERGNRDAEIGARHASAASFGGSGAALERAQLNRGHGQQVAQTIGSLLSGGYDRSSQLAEGNANRRLSAATAASGASIDHLDRRTRAADSFLRYGTLQQAQDQAQQDRVRSLLDWYASGIPGAPATTSETQPIWGNPIETALSLAF